MAKMAPAKKENVIFKASIFGLPSDGTYAETIDYTITQKRLKSHGYHYASVSLISNRLESQSQVRTRMLLSRSKTWTS